MICSSHEMIVSVSLLELETKLYIAQLQSRATFGVSLRFTNIEEAVAELEDNEIVLYVDIYGWTVILYFDY